VILTNSYTDGKLISQCWKTYILVLKNLYTGFEKLISLCWKTYISKLKNLYNDGKLISWCENLNYGMTFMIGLGFMCFTQNQALSRLNILVGDLEMTV
jgi:hypothetical protein